MLQVEGLGFAYARRPAVLRGVSFELGAGQALCLLGTNGSGKTTLLRCVLGLEVPAEGRVCVDGDDVARLSAARRARRMAYVPQGAATLFPFSVYDVVLLGRSPHLRFPADPAAADHRAVREALERVAIAHLQARQFHELSGGERQLTLLARALAQQAPLLVLDEPCSGLDLGHQVQVLQALASLMRDGHALLMATHLPEHAFALAAQVVLLAGGTISGPQPAAEALTAPALSRLYGVPVDVVQVPDGAARGQRVCVPVLNG